MPGHPARALVVEPGAGEHRVGHAATVSGRRSKRSAAGRVAPLEKRKTLTEMPVVIDAQYDGDYRIRVTFDDGSRNTIDFRKWLIGPVFEPLRDAKYFQRFFVSGGTVAWPNGADIAPETLYDVAGRTRARRPQSSSGRSPQAHRPKRSGSRLRS